MKYAFLVNDVVQAVVEDDPVALFGPEFGNQFVVCPDDVQNYWIRDPLTNTYTAPPPPPLTRNNFENAFISYLGARAEAKRQALFEAALALSPNAPGLPNSIPDFLVILSGMELPE